MKKSILACILTFVMLVSLMQMNAFADGGEIAGNGTQLSPYQISDESTLLFVVGKLNAGDAAFAGKVYILTSDIRLTGTFPMINTFNGTFDGQGYKITGLSVIASGGNAGFIKENSGTVKNVTFENASVTATGNAYRVGVVSGVAKSNSLISLVRVTGNVTVSSSGESHVGGIVGAAGDAGGVNARIQDTSFVGSVASKGAAGALAGGIAGYVGGTVERCFAMADLLVGSGSGIRSGAIIGAHKSAAAMTGNVAYGGRLSYAMNYDSASVYRGSIYASGGGTVTSANNLANEAGITVCRTDIADPNGVPLSTAKNVQSPPNPTGIAVKTSDELMRKSTYESIGWDFSSVWVMYQDTERGVTYPIPRYVMPTSQKVEAEDVADHSNTALISLNNANASNGKVITAKMPGVDSYDWNVPITAPLSEYYDITVAVSNSATFATYMSPLTFSVDGGEEIPLDKTVCRIVAPSSAYVDESFQFKIFTYKQPVQLEAGGHVITLHAKKRAAFDGDGIYFGFDYLQISKTKRMEGLYAEVSYPLVKGSSGKVNIRNIDDEVISTEQLDSVNYTVEDETIAVIDSYGVLTARNYGNTRIEIDIILGGQSFHITEAIQVTKEDGIYISGGERNGTSARVTVGTTQAYSGHKLFVFFVLYGNDNGVHGSMKEAGLVEVPDLVAGVEKALDFQFDSVDTKDTVAAYLICPDAGDKVLYRKVLIQ